MPSKESPSSSPIVYTSDVGFTTRFRSRFSSLHPLPTTNSSPTAVDKKNAALESSFTDSSKLNLNNAVTWTKMKDVCNDIYSRNCQISQGEAICLTISDKYIAIATSKGFILIYNDAQKLLCKIGSRKETTDYGIITSLEFSPDSEMIAAGYQRGHISLWKIGRPENPSIDIPSVTNVKPADQKPIHLSGNSITGLCFVGIKNTELISTDESGTMIIHRFSHTLFRIPYSHSDYLMGPNNPFHISKRTQHIILGFSLLPLGSYPQKTDNMRILAIITPHTLIVVSVAPRLRNYLRIRNPHRPEDENIRNDNNQIFGSVSWYPATIKKSENKHYPPILAYYWNNTLTILEMYSDDLEGNADTDSLLLRFENKKVWVCSEQIVHIEWVNSDILVCLTISQRLFFLGRDSKRIALLSVVDLTSKHIKNSKRYLNMAGIQNIDYQNTFKAIKSNMFILGRNSFYFGVLNTWADILFGQIKDGHYIEALETASKQYKGDCNMDLIRLPRDDELRHQIISKHISQILDASLNFLFSDDMTRLPEENKKSIASRFIDSALAACSTIDVKPEIYDTLLEKYIFTDLEDVFFNSLESSILNGQTGNLPPFTLKHLFQYYISTNRADTLEEILCRMDISQLDVDLAIRLCRKHHLTDTLIYIWNVLFHDYISPVFEAIQIARQTPSNTSIDYIYTYIAYILTGRQYPTDITVSPPEQARSAKLNMYYMLFNGASISYPDNSPNFHVTSNVKEEPAFPYLHFLLKHDVVKMLLSLNEAFEDTLLNDDEVVSRKDTGHPYEFSVSRQYIVNVLFDMFNQISNDFSSKDRTYLSIFIAQNYSKYKQFIRLSDSTLDGIIEGLCSTTDSSLKHECEIGIQSLLSVYKPANRDSLVALLESSKMHNTLLYIYRSENRYLQILDMWFKSMEDTQGNVNDEDNEEYQLSEAIPSIIEKCLAEADSASISRFQVENLLRAHFGVLVQKFPKDTARIIATKCHSLLECALSHEDESIQRFKYFDYLFKMQFQGKLTTKLSPDFVIAYAKLLRKFDRNSLEDFALSLNGSDEFLLKFLEENHEDEILVKLYAHNHQYSKAVSQATEKIKKRGQNMIDSNSYDEVSAEIMLRLINMCFVNLRNLRKVPSSNSDDGKLTENEQLLLDLIEICVKMFNTVSTENNGEPNDDQVLKLLKRITQITFTQALTENQDNADSFLNVFYAFLNRSSLMVTTLKDVRPVLSEIFLSYSHDTVIQKLILRLVNDSIYGDLLKKDKLNLKGWSLSKVECEICGKKIWGAHIDPNNFELWQDHVLEKNLGEEQEKLDKELEAELSICVFQCGHGYHVRCLQGLGVNDKSRYCIVCKRN